MTFEYKLPIRRSRTLPKFQAEPKELPGGPPRVARLVALAHALEARVRSGLAKDYVEIARQARISPARVAQVVERPRSATESIWICRGCGSHWAD